jgi:3-phenylpropionate/cinnamic acid dioxygenase small subunit
MTAGLLSIADRLEIQDLLADYCFSIDDHDWVRFRALFTDGAVLDFSAFGGPRCSAAAMVDYLQGVAATLQSWQHTVSTLRLSPQGADSVRARTAAQVFLTSKGKDGAAGPLTSVGLWYHDLLVRTPEGWRIAERVQKFGWAQPGAQG